MNKIKDFNSRPFRYRYFVFFNIGMQIAFPLSLSFTPIMLAHATEQPNSFLILPTTQTYTLKLDDTVASIAKQHGVTVNELKKLNQFRTFSKPFEDLTVGDEIDIPANTKWLNTPQQNELISSTDVARTASQLGSTFNNNSSSNAAKDLARSIAVGEMNAQTNSEISDWLQGKGKARVKIDVDNEFTLKNSELEVLVPIWELPEHMVFSQASLHRTDSRTQSNLGVGYRFFSPDYMLGINTFYDHDWSRSHSRVGLGAEYQRDFMKLSANSYHRTSDWKNSKDFDFYEERPANGWDVRAEGYLPAYPAIGGKLMYEQYYGDNVGLFGKDNQQKDPYAVTVGANYTPFPLLTFNAEQRQGKSGENDTRFGIDLKYTLGVPLSKQLDSEQIYASRLLNANRYDFVERNNNIVLEYRKKETITIQLPAQISGYTGEKRDIGLTISSKNGLSRVEWYAPELIAHGGQIIRESISQYSVVMPNYQYGSGANNHYTLSMVAYDESGNQSPESTTTVIVNSAAVDLASSKLSPLEVNLPNDGKSTEQLTLKLENKDGQPVSGIASEITTQITTISGSSSDIKLSEYTESANEPGTYYVTVTAGLSSGEFTLTPKIQGISISPAKVITGKSPKISNLNISGKLALGETLSGTYIFDANGSNTEDKSQYQWTNEGNKRALNGIKTVETSGIIPGYILVKDDVGKIKMLTVKAINGLNTEGNTETVTTAPGSDGNHTDGGNNGGIVDEAGVPKVSNVAISGKLNVGQVLSGSYVFAAQTGNPTDASVVMWGDNGTTVAELDANNGTPVTNGTLPTYTLVTADVGKVKAVSVRAKNGAGVVGNTETVTTAPGSDGNHTDGGNNGGITDEAGAPKVSNVAISGKLNVGQVLSGSYTFDAQTGNPTDASVAMWGDNGTTVAELDAGNGTVVTDGNLPTYTLVTADVGKVKAVSVRAKNGAGVVGNTETVTTAPGSDGNHTDGGNNGGITDEVGAPKVSNVAISGKLNVGEVLSGSYVFAAQTGNPADASVAVWGDNGTTVAELDANNGTPVTNGTLPTYTLVTADVGKVKAVSVRAKNGAGVVGNTETVTTAPGSDGNHTDGGNNGGITDETGAPKVSNVSISGKLNVGQVLSGSYVFAAQTGNPTDASVAMWGDNGTTVAELDAGNGTVVTDGNLPTYTLVTADVGKVKAVSVRAKNGAGVVGNTETVTTAPGSDGNHTDGGNNGGITDETGAPKVSNVAISGKLNVGQVLSGSYVFAAQTGNPTDASVAVWGNNGTTVAELDANNGTKVTNGTLPTYTLVAADIGKVKAVSVRAKNGAGVVGNTETVTTAPGSDGNHTDGGNNGGITDEAGAPKVSNVAISGKLNVGQVLSGSYVFAAQTGNPTDASVAVWGDNGTTVAELDANNGTKVTNGTLPTYTLVAADIGKVKAVSVRAKNGAGVVGNTITVTTVPSSNGNNTNSGNIDGSGSVIGYTFKLTPETLRLGETMKHQYTLAATDIKSGQSVTIPANTVTWSTKDSAVAVADSTGIITAKKEGSTSVIVKGIYKNQPFQAEAIINISPLVKSPLFGYGTGSSATVVVEPPNYTISVRCGGIVDNMGGIGGSGGTPSIVKDVSNVTKIVTNTGLYEKNNVLSSITFHYGDGTSQKCGREEPQTVTIVKSETYMIPNGYRLQGFTAFGGQYVTGVQYITVEK